MGAFPIVTKDRPIEKIFAGKKPDPLISISIIGKDEMAQTTSMFRYQTILCLHFCYAVSTAFRGD